MHAASFDLYSITTVVRKAFKLENKSRKKMFGQERECSGQMASDKLAKKKKKSRLLH